MCNEKNTFFFKKRSFVITVVGLLYFDKMTRGTQDGERSRTTAVAYLHCSKRRMTRKFGK
jgi:hypothetical protein